MSLEGLLTIIGLLVAVYALAQPIQRHSLPLFVPFRWVLTLIIVSAFILTLKHILSFTMGPEYVCYEWVDFGLMMGGLVLSVVAGLIAMLSWNKAKLKKEKDKKFHNFIHTSINENKFDELIRILEKNEESLVEVLSSDTLDVLFERKFVQQMFRGHIWLHLRLLTNEDLRNKLVHESRAINNVMRELVASDTSPLHSSITQAYGGRENVRITSSEWELIQKTLRNPLWYMSVRADYPLIVNAYEELASGKYDRPYNQNDDLYIFHQGESSRLKCPVFLALKTHVLMLKEAIKIEGEENYYTSDLWNLFQNVCNHSRFDWRVWENRDANSEYPTPFAYLMKEILYDLRTLCERAYEQGEKPLGRIGDNLIRTWATCVANLGHSKDKVSNRFKSECIGYYLSHTLKTMEAFEKAEGDRKEKIKQWKDILVEELKRYRSGDDELGDTLFHCMNDLDIGKRYIFDYHKQLRIDLELPERPKPEG